MLSIIKPQTEKLLQPVAHLLRNVNPNSITLLGMIFPILFFVFVMHEMYLLALVAFVFNAVDLLDGLVARAHNKVTAFGGFLDSTVDRFADFVVIVAFGFAGLVNWYIVLTLVLLTYLISYIRSRTELAAKDSNLIANVGIVERPERLITVFLGLAIYALWQHVEILDLNLASITFLVLIAGSAITVAQRIHFAYKHL
jgi:archaetidylinositol phosphate synthase